MCNYTAIHARNIEYKIETTRHITVKKIEYVKKYRKCVRINKALSQSYFGR